MRRFALLTAAVLALSSASAAAQSWSGTHESRYGDQSYGDRDGYGRRSGWSAAPSTFDWRSQLDRPGDYRCDAFWDASRIDCGAAWRDQRRRVSPQARSDYRDLAGYGRDGYDRYGEGRYGYNGGYGRSGYPGPRGHGSAEGGYGQGGAAWYGAYGRPDLLYPAGGRGYGSGAEYGSRADWCRAHYRSYDPYTGYYRGYSGRLIYCG
ncbi:BA14K family protein [Brevundimonas sp.]|uniref:BA14K family protein n=1 Tax=Brevundimonas sp. TaxID=1871086 RepID=UPI003565E496